MYLQYLTRKCTKSQLTNLNQLELLLSFDLLRSLLISLSDRSKSVQYSQE